MILGEVSDDSKLGKGFFETLGSCICPDSTCVFDGLFEPLDKLFVSTTVLFDSNDAAGVEFLSATKSIFSNYLRNIVSGHKIFLAPN